MTRKQIMTLAWTLKKLDSRNLFSECLRLAWQVSRESDLSAQLEMLGFNRWQKNGMDRMYINCESLGVDITYYNSGNICSAYLDGESISNSEAREYKFQKVYYDMEDGRVYRNKHSYQGREMGNRARLLVSAVLGDIVLFNI